jgi:hypothetical protein
MKPHDPRPVVYLTAAFALVIVACTCAPLTQIGAIQGTAGAIQSTLGPALTEVDRQLPTFEAAATSFAMTVTVAKPSFDATTTAIVATADALASGGVTRQWATNASASSEYNNPDWSAMQATGGPNTFECNDRVTAWASATPTGLDTLHLDYNTAVIPTAISIYQNYFPGSVVKVEVVDLIGNATTVYQAAAAPVPQCPYIQVIPISNVTEKVNAIIITLDQSVIGQWDEIDAVELIGK